MIHGRMRGLPEAKARLKLLGEKVEVISPLAVKAGAEVTARLMRDRAPRLTGRLISRIKVTVENTRDGAVARVGSDVPYDPFVQKGTVYMEPQAYGEEAAREGEADIVHAIATVYKAALPR